MENELRMAELLCTRLCHDLTGPIGAVNNGAEFLSEEGSHMQNQAMELIASSAFSAVSRLQFYRFAYGNVKESGEASLADKRKMAGDFFFASKITLDWPDTDTDASGVSISLKMVRLIFNLLILASSALIRGGTISIRVRAGENNRKHISVSAQGAQVKWDSEITEAIEGKLSVEKLTPKNVQAQMTYNLLLDLHANLSVTSTAESLIFEVEQPF